MSGQDKARIDRLRQARRRYAHMRRQCCEFGVLTPAGKVAVGAIRQVNLDIARLERNGAAL